MKVETESAARNQGSTYFIAVHFSPSCCFHPLVFDNLKMARWKNSVLHHFLASLFLDVFNIYACLHFSKRFSR